MPAAVNQAGYVLWRVVNITWYVTGHLCLHNGTFPFARYYHIYLLRFTAMEVAIHIGTQLHWIDHETKISCPF